MNPKKNVSKAAQRNWQKLGTNSQKLQTRANKTQSTKTRIPKEYFENAKYIQEVVQIVDYIKQNDIGVRCAINSLCLNLIKNNGSSNKFVPFFVECLSTDCNKELLQMQLPSCKKDIGGAIYQCLLNEGEKSVRGSYYTPHAIKQSLLHGIMLKGDDKQYFSLNSANILIPQVEGISAKTVLAFVNSKLMQFVYKVKFGKQIKVLKSNLCKLPFANISVDMDAQITQLVDATLNGNDKTDEIDALIYKIYNLTDDEIVPLERELE